MNNYLKTLSLAVIAISTSTTSYAGDAIGPGDKDSRWILGGGVATSTNIYAGEDNIGSAYPDFAFNGERFFVKNGTINYSLMQWQNISTGVTLAYDANFLSFESEYRDNEKLSGLQEREATLDGGFYINYTTELGRLNFSFLTDIGNEHDGHSATLQYTFDLRMGDWYVNPVIGTSWASANKVDHYFGVRASEVTAARAAYKGDDTFNFFAGIRGRYELTEHWDLDLKAGVSKFGSGITDSTIVDDDTGYYGAASIRYSF